MNAEGCVGILDALSDFGQAVILCEESNEEQKHV